jgi:hypothetical protein
VVLAVFVKDVKQNGSFLLAFVPKCHRIMKFGMALRDVGPLLTLYYRAVGKAEAFESLKITSDIRSRGAQDIYVDRQSGGTFS